MQGRKGWAGLIYMSVEHDVVWVVPSVDMHKNFLKRSQAVAGGGHPVDCYSLLHKDPASAVLVPLLGGHPHINRTHMDTHALRA